MTPGALVMECRVDGMVPPRCGGGLGQAIPAPRRAIGVAWLTVSCLVTGGCATVGGTAPLGRQAVIDRIVSASAKVILERGGQRLGSGSGTVVGSRPPRPGVEAVSYILTAAHVLESKGKAEVFVRFTGGYAKQGKLAATILRRGSADTLDLALLRVAGITVPAIPLADAQDIRLGQAILLVGFPWGKRLGLFSGIVSQVPAGGSEAVSDEGTEQTMVVDASSAKGVSGGGVFREATGSLVGIVEGYQTASIALKESSRTYSVKVPLPGETFVIPITRIRQFLDEAGIAGGQVPP
ncbi:MAG TPA: serine protease [Candidatus Methylomirabilis sp.]|nr:serine protease [Candidatus Methylomirabilis sp.]HSB81058.1 serine protease [Candidatus Methylomirabilis sp.]